MKRRPALYVAKSALLHTPTACLDCGELLNAAAGVGHKRKPRAGSIAICVRCGHIQAYGWDLQFRALTDEEMIALAGNKVLVATSNAVRMVQNRRAAEKP